MSEQGSTSGAEESSASTSSDAPTPTPSEPVVYFGTFGHGEFALQRRLCTRQVLSQLMGLKAPSSLVVVTCEGDEVTSEGGSYALKANTPQSKYLLATEEEVEEGGFVQPKTQHEVHAFLARRERMVEKKRELIKEHFRPLHPEIYEYSDSFLHPDLRSALDHPSDADGALQRLVTKEAETGLYTLPFFTPHFCALLCEEVHHFERSGLPTTRPNSMNNYGVILDDIGFTPFLTRLRERCVLPLASLLFKHRGGASIDGHHGFVVQYTMKGDRKLDFHFDDSEVTLNVCLGMRFQGGALYFRGILEEESTHTEEVALEHRVGVGLVHAGKHRHGAMPIEAGERLNLILWCRSSSYRAAHAHGQCACCAHD